MSTTGIDLIRAMAAGDHDAFGRFYDRYAPLVFSFVLCVVGDRADAAEALQDTFWEAWRDAAAYDPARGTPEAWLVMRARSRALDRVRGARRRAEASVAPAEEATALARLPRMQREAIELAYYAGLTQSEIAERLEQPLGTVKTRLRFGLARLREVVAAT